MDATITNGAPASETEPTSDAQLVQTSLRGKRQAFSTLYQRHAGWLFPVLWRLAGGDRGCAEDWLQESFITAWQRLDQLRDGNAFGGWLKRLAVNIALTDQRRNRIVSVDRTTESSAPEPPWPAADLDLERAIAGLPVRARQVLVLFHLDGWTHAEIAETLGVEVGTSKAQLHRARQMIKEKLA